MNDVDRLSVIFPNSGDFLGFSVLKITVKYVNLVCKSRKVAYKLHFYQALRLKGSWSNFCRKRFCFIGLGEFNLSKNALKLLFEH